MRSPAGGSWYFPADVTEPSHPADLLGEGPYGALLAVLEESRERGFLGPGPVSAHIVRSLDLLTVLGRGPEGPEPISPPDGRAALDLGSGGGVPGLVLAMALPMLRWFLLDGSATRCSFLRSAVEQLSRPEQAPPVEVIEARAEEAGHRPDLRARFSLVVSRSFAAPAVTAECASPFLEVGGHLIVAEPPDVADRWPAERLSTLGLEVGPRITEPSCFQVLHQVSPCPARFPRRVGIPAKRPLF